VVDWSVNGLKVRVLSVFVLRLMFGRLFFWSAFNDVSSNCVGWCGGLRDDRDGRGGGVWVEWLEDADGESL